MTHDELRESIAVYALDALDQAEAREVEAHLATCEECRAALETFRRLAADLAVGAPQVEPPAVLRDRIMAVVRAEAGDVSPVTPIEPLRPVTPPRAPVRRGSMAALAAAAALIVVLGALAVSMNQRLAALNSRLAAQEQVLALLASPTARTASLSGAVQASVRFVYDFDRGQGALVVSDLADPGRDFVYQLWLVAGQEPESAGVFRPVPGQAIVVPVAAEFGRYQAVAISVERAPSGAARPTTTPILLARL
jgi:anti-sigma-K factor RskA